MADFISVVGEMLTGAVVQGAVSRAVSMVLQGEYMESLRKAVHFSSPLFRHLFEWKTLLYRTVLSDQQRGLLNKAVEPFDDYNSNILFWPLSFLVNLIKRIDLIVRHICTATIIHCTPANDIVEQQKRCTKYSQQAILFAISTFSAYVTSASFTTRDTTIKVATVAFFIAVIADLLSWRMKPKWGRGLVYISSFHLLLMTFLIFISLDKDYGYAIVFVLLMIGAVVLRCNLWHAVQIQRTVDAVNQDLNFMFELSTLILNWDSIINILITISGPNNCIAPGTTGYLFFCTIILSLYLMMVTTVRTVALTIHAKYLDILLMVLLVATLISTSITFIYSYDEATDGEVPT